MGTNILILFLRSFTHSDSIVSHRVLKSTKQGHARIMKEARALQAGAVVYRSGGKLYLLEDHKMPSGNMMFEENWFKQALGDPSGY